jgi:hypothetical protein
MIGRTNHLVAPLLALALSAGCLAEVTDGEVSGQSDELFQAVPYNPEEVCDFRMTSAAGAGTLALPYCATADLSEVGPPLTQIRRLVFAQHGRGSNAQLYLTYMNQAINGAVGDRLIREDQTFVVAPQFIEPKELEDVYPIYFNDLFVWDAGGVDNDWAIGGLSSWDGAPGQRSSFSLLEELMAMAMARMPNLDEIIFVGQSAGGQFTQRYAILNDFDFPEGVHVRYVPTNAWAYAYPTNERRDFVFGGYEEPNMFVSFKYYNDTQVCTPDEEWETCEGYDTYQRGLGRIPATHWAASVLPKSGPPGSDPDFVENVDILAVGLRYRLRDVTYLVAESDIAHAGQCNCADQMQGESTRQRAQLISDYMKTEWSAPGHDVVVVPDTGHGGQNLARQCGRAAIFGRPDRCQPLEEHSVSSGWGGRVVSIAWGNVDDDAADEVAVVTQQGLTGHVLVLDDEANGYAVLYEPTAGWGFLQIPQEVAFGDVDGDGRDELGVVRTTNAGPSWYVYRLSDGGNWYAQNSGGADWPAPRSAYHLAFGDLDGNGDDELIVARHATTGPRFYYYGIWSNQLFSERSYGSLLADGIAVTDVAAGDTNGDGKDEIALAVDAPSGARAYVHRLNGQSVSSVSTIGTGWRTNHIIRHLAFGNVDEDDGEEMLIGRSVYPGYDRWVVMDDAAASYAVLLAGGRNGDPGWPSDASITDVAFGFIDEWSLYPTIAISALSAEGPVLEIATLEMVGKDEDRHLVVGDYSRPHVAANVDVLSVAFGDVEGLGGDEIVYGVDDAHLVGFGVRVLPTP